MRWAILLILTLGTTARAQATRPATAPVVRPVPAAALFAKLPADARPDRAGWPAVAVDKANRWVAQTHAGAVVEEGFTIRSVEVVEGKAIKGLATAWAAVVELEDGSVALSARAHTLRIVSPTNNAGPTLGSFVFGGDEAFAARARKWKRGDAIRVRGVLEQAPITPASATVAPGATPPAGAKRPATLGTVDLMMHGLQLVSVGAYRPSAPIPAAVRSPADPKAAPPAGTPIRPGDSIFAD